MPCAWRLASSHLFVTVAAGFARELEARKQPLVGCQRASSRLPSSGASLELACLPAYRFSGSIPSLCARPPAVESNFCSITCWISVEVLTGALLLRPRSILLPRFTERAYLIRFVGFGVLAGPALAGSIYVLTLHFWEIAAPQNAFLRWMAADSLGIAIATPAFAAVFQADFSNIANWKRDWFYPALLLAVAFAAFAQNTVPLIYLIYPLLVLILVRLGLGYASLFTLLIAAIAGWLTIRGLGPFANGGSSNPALAIGSCRFRLHPQFFSFTASPWFWRAGSLRSAVCGRSSPCTTW